MKSFGSASGPKKLGHPIQLAYDGAKQYRPDMKTPEDTSNNKDSEVPQGIKDEKPHLEIVTGASEPVRVLPGQARYQKLKLHLKRAISNGNYELASTLRGQVRGLARELRLQNPTFETALMEAAESTCHCEDCFDETDEIGLTKVCSACMKEEDSGRTLREWAEENLEIAICKGNLEEVAYLEDLLEELRKERKAATTKMRRWSERSMRSPGPDHN